MKDLFSIEELLAMGSSQEETESHVRRAMFNGGYSTAEINDYFSGANAVDAAYSQPQYAALRKPAQMKSPGVLKYLQYGCIYSFFYIIF